MEYLISFAIGWLIASTLDDSHKVGSTTKITKEPFEGGNK
jgi:hypothetical protein